MKIIGLEIGVCPACGVYVYVDEPKVFINGRFYHANKWCEYFGGI